MCQPTLLSALVKEAAVTGEDFDAAEEALRNFNRRIEETRGFDPDQWLPSELIDCAIISLLDAPALRLASVLSRGWRRRAQSDTPWLVLCRSRWHLPPNTSVQCAAPPRLLYGLARPAPTMRKGLRAGTQLRVGESKSGLVTLAFGGALGVGDRSCVADAPFFGDQAITKTPQQRAPADGSFSRRIFGPALTGASTQSPLAVARSLMNRHSSKPKSTPKCVATPRAVQEETFPFSGTAIRVAPSLIAYFELRVALSGAPREVEERAMAAPPCVAIGCARAGFDAGRLMPGWDSESWGYHGDDGGRFHGDGAAVARGDTFGRGDVVGCGVDRGRREVFFTRNGVSVGGIPLQQKDLDEPLYPCVGLDHGDAVEVNFGAEPFAYDVRSRDGGKDLSRALAKQCAPLAGGSVQTGCFCRPRADSSSG